MNCLLTHSISLVSHPQAPAGFVAGLTSLGYGGPQVRKLLADRVLRNLGKDEDWWTTSFALGFFLARTPRRARPCHRSPASCKRSTDWSRRAHSRHISRWL